LEYGNDVDYMVTYNGVLFHFFYRFFDKANKKQNLEKESPLDILKRRYANGELSTAEYEERKNTLGGN
jgi:putative membrane protein